MLHGEIWMVRFSPSEGDEISKIRPAVILNELDAGCMRLRIVVPITRWQSRFEEYLWMVHLLPEPSNGLSKESAADTFQIKSVPTNRFQEKIGGFRQRFLKNFCRLWRCV
jgi:mRNA interferase MazF